MIAIVDYGMGNLRSVQKACEKLHVPATICTQPEQLRTADKIILPGVGAFRDAIHELTRQSLVEPVREHIAAGKDFLGICLGLQLLFEIGHEDGDWPGLAVVPGEVVRFPETDLKVPHMGWNQLQVAKPCPLLKDIPEKAWFYFVHSYYVVPQNDDVIVARTDYGIPFVSVIGRDNMFATQFHPEKSQTHGLQLLANFAAL